MMIAGSSPATETQTMRHDLPGTSSAPSESYYERAWSSAWVTQADSAVRRAFYRCNIPFHVARTLAWREMVSALVAVPPACKQYTVCTLESTQSSTYIAHLNFMIV